MSDAEVNDLRKAMKGLGTNDNKLISVMTARRNNDEMVALVKRYAEVHGRDLVKDIKDETTFNYEKVLVTLATDRAALDAKLLNEAVKGIGTNENKLNEILCTRSPAELKAIEAAYEAEFKKSVLEDVQGDTSGDAKKLYTALLTSERSTPPDTSLSSHAKELYDAGENRMGTDEQKFIDILGTHSLEYVRKLNKEYQSKYGHDLRWVVKDEFSGGILGALKALVTPVEDYFAKQLKEAMYGLGTDDGKLIRILASQRFYPGRLAAIAIAFSAPKKESQPGKKKTKEKKEKPAKDKSKEAASLREYILKETSGDYEKALISLFDNFCVEVTKPAKA